MISDCQFLLFLFLLVVVALCVHFFSLGFVVVRSSIVCVFVDVADFLALEFSFQYFVQGWISRQVLFKSDFVMEYLFSLSTVIECFAGYSSFGWHLWSLSICIKPVQDLLLSLFPMRRWGNSNRSSFICQMAFFSFVTFNILSLF